MKKFLLLIGVVVCVPPIVHAKENRISPPLPKIIAHRGGPTNWPPNTVCAVRKGLEAGVDAIEIDVQVSRDGDVVLYHPDDLSEQTTASGKVAEKTTLEIVSLDASAKYQGSPDYKKACAPEELKIAKLTDVLQKFSNATFFVDLKSLPAEPLVKALARQIPKSDLKRLVFYSTNAEHLVAIDRYLPHAVHFEDRAKTFDRLVTFAGTHRCTLLNKASYVGFELFRELEICEKFKLGGNCHKTHFEMWSHESMSCTDTMTSSAKVIMFGVDTAEAYEKARQLGAYAVYSNDPKSLLEYSSKQQKIR